MAKPKKSKEPEKPLAEEVGRTLNNERIVAVPAQCLLAPEDRIRKGSELAEALDEVERLEGEKSRNMADFNKELKDARKKAKDLREAYKTSTERRMVSCIEVPDFTRGVIELRRVEGNDLVETRTMTEAEKQMPLRMAAQGIAKEAVADAVEAAKVEVPLVSEPPTECPTCKGPIKEFDPGKYMCDSNSCPWVGQLAPAAPPAEGPPTLTASDELSPEDRATAEAIREASDWIEQYPGGRESLVMALRGLNETSYPFWLQTQHAPPGVLDQIREDLARDAAEREERREEKRKPKDDTDGTGAGAHA